jgi:SNF2 family DNA or RNA helicase
MDTVFAALQPAIRFRKSDCVELPPTTYVMKQATLSDDQRKAYRSMRATFTHQAESGTVVRAANAAVQVGKLLQIAAGVVKTSTTQDDDEATLQFDVSSRMKLVLEFVEESQSKTVVLVPYVAVLRRLVKYLEDKGYSCGIVDGSVTGTARAKVLEAFSNHREPRVLVCNPKAASHGLNLQVADTLVFYSPVLSLDTYLQARERIARPGQQNHMVIGEIAATKLEARFYDALRVNEKFSESLLNMYNEVLDETVARV